ncbi:MAG: glycosyltransferase family 2 protein [Gammaproteobacteria bacterium]|nr:glycosyltransferase family 2 protein [Gammaproteobacteria bacterium]MDE0650845.1 glycosyltransferase family 2 protein [Gammaproteobacteria bacterium]MYC53531.1 glycosyltransferase [Gammaproteobacteria bacterium]
MLIVAAVTLAVWVAMALITLYSYRRVFRLERIGDARDCDPPLPRLSVVVAARNEEAGVERALASLLALDYPDYEVIFVDDRSQDRTGEIADRLSAQDDRLTVLHVEELPAGWFGKNHASWKGALAASGDLLLFTDGDVVFGRGAVRRGVRHLQRNRLDHFAVLPALVMRSLMLQACVIVFHWGAHITARLWQVRDPRSTASFGVGAYNLFRADSYRAIGGHRQVALRPDEDYQLGRLVKLTGHRSDLVRAESSVWCEWYPDVRSLVRGLEKNLFAFRDYRMSAVLVQTVGLVWTGIAPVVLGVALVPVDAFAAALFAAAAMVAWGFAICVARVSRFRWWSGLALPVASAVIAWSWWRSMIVTLRGRLAWGGPAVPLSELRAARVRAMDERGNA